MWGQGRKKKNKMNKMKNSPLFFVDLILHLLKSTGIYQDEFLHRPLSNKMKTQKKKKSQNDKRH